MKIIFIKDFGVGGIGAKIGDEFEVVGKKEPDKWNDYIRYQIRIANVGLINVPSNDTPRIQEAHITVGHIICEMVEAGLFSRD